MSCIEIMRRRCGQRQVMWPASSDVASVVVKSCFFIPCTEIDLSERITRAAGTTRELRGNYAGTTRELRGNYAGTTRELRGNYAETTRGLRGNYARTTRELRGNYAGTTRGLRRIIL